MSHHKRLSDELTSAGHGLADAINYGARALCSAMSLFFLGLSRLCDYLHNEISTVRHQENHEAPVPDLGENRPELR